jgi:hypothetical protein
VREYVARIRALQWQAMQVRTEEIVPCLSCKQCLQATAADTLQHAATGGTCDGDLTGAGADATASNTGVPDRGFKLRFAELPETGLSELGQYCKEAGVEHLFLSALKLSGK